jgi:predicted DCC family thiol-disulfide oxidoreductase YuxK
MDPRTRGPTVVFFDGVCGLCDRFVQFLLARDREGVLLFALLQGELAQQTLTKYGFDASNLDSVVAVSDWKLPHERASTQARAVLVALDALGGGWRVFAHAARIVPVPLANVVYRLVARWRYRLFGRFETCQLPRPEWKGRFLE